MKKSKHKSRWQKPSFKVRSRKAFRTLSGGSVLAIMTLLGMHALGFTVDNFRSASSPAVTSSTRLLADASTAVSNANNTATSLSAVSSPTDSYRGVVVVDATSVDLPTTITASVSVPNTLSNAIVDIEIYSSDGYRVDQYTEDDQSLTTNAQAYHLSWTPAATGTYSVKIGIFSANWSKTYYWNDHAASFTIAAVKTATNSSLASSGTTASWMSQSFYVDPSNDALAYAVVNAAVPGANLIEREGQTPVADWFGGFTPNVAAAVNAYVSSAANVHQTPVLVLYNIPDRDCGGYSAGGATDEASYNSWVQQVASGIGENTAVVIEEPDALAGIDCLSSADQQLRYSEISQAVTVLKGNPNTHVYLDAGNPTWQSSTTMAPRLKAANIANADGFSLNVSNFITTASNVAYGNQLSALVGNKHFVVDTSRNGSGADSDGEWCNPSNRSLGPSPTTDTGDALADAFIWAKIPWGSDGPCNGGPGAGQDFWSYAVSLAENAGW